MHNNPVPDRRRFMLQCAAGGLAATTATILSTTAATDSAAPIAPKTDTTAPRLVIDALGGISNPNLSEEVQEGPGQGIDARGIADAKAAGLCAFNQTLGYVFGPATPAEQIAQTDRDRFMSAVHRHEIQIKVNQNIALDGAFIHPKRFVVARLSDGNQILVVFRVVIVITVGIKFVENRRTDHSLHFGPRPSFSLLTLATSHS